MKLIITLLFSINIFASTIGKVIFVKGDVQVNSKAIKRGYKLKAMDIITTGKKSLAVIKLHDKSTIKLDKRSKIRVTSLVDKLKPTKVEISVGSAFFNVLKKKQIDRSKPAKFQVQTKTAAMGVRGTTFFVSAQDKSNNFDTWMCVKEGLVEAKRHKSKKSVLVKTGEGVKLARSEKVESPRPLPWTQGLNWEFDTNKEIENKVDISNAYKDLLDEDYD
jgi:ferric-dicitrate binding protein FerR (iron transport regulator)